MPPFLGGCKTTKDELIHPKFRLTYYFDQDETIKKVTIGHSNGNWEQDFLHWVKYSAGINSSKQKKGS